MFGGGHPHRLVVVVAGSRQIAPVVHQPQTASSTVDGEHQTPALRWRARRRPGRDCSRDTLLHGLAESSHVLQQRQLPKIWGTSVSMCERPFDYFALRGFYFFGQMNARVIGTRGATSLEVCVMDRAGSGGGAGGRHTVLLRRRGWLRR